MTGVGMSRKKCGRDKSGISQAPGSGYAGWILVCHKGRSQEPSVKTGRPVVTNAARRPPHPAFPAKPVGLLDSADVGLILVLTNSFWS
jgi:hypothetical protein